MGKGKKALLIVSLIILLCVLAFVAYMVFQVREIAVSGCETKGQDYIISLSGLQYKQSIFEVDTQKVMDAISADPYIKPVSVEIDYPDCVKITVEERKEAAYIEKDGSLLVIDDECYLLQILMPTDEIRSPMIYGMQMDEAEVGKKLGSKDTYQLSVLSSVLQAAENSGFGLKSIDLTYTSNVILETEEGFKVELGDDTNLETKIKLIKSSVKELKDMGKTGGILDVASAKKVYYRENLD